MKFKLVLPLCVTLMLAVAGLTATVQADPAQRSSSFCDKHPGHPRCRTTPAPTPTTTTTSPSPTSAPTTAATSATPTAAPTSAALTPTPTATTTTSPTATTSQATTSCNGPLNITTGGTYTGCYASTSSESPAVRVSTTQPVVLDHLVVRHAGVGVEEGTSGSSITLRNSTFTATAPTTTGAEQQAVRLYRPDSLVIEHNRFVSGHGIQVNGNNVQTNPFRISFNDFQNIGRLSRPQYYQGAVHTDKVLAPGGKIMWNRVKNQHGLSNVEDVFGLASTFGANGNPIEVGYNLVDGAYPFSGDGSNYSGGAFDFADITGGYIDGHDNTAVNYTNNGFMIPTGTNVHHRNSVAVYDGIADDGQRVSSTFGTGFTTWHNSGYPDPDNIGVTNSQAGQRRWNGSSWERSDYYLPLGSNSGNSSSGTVDAAAEKAAVDQFEQSVTAHGVTIGPLS